MDDAATSARYAPGSWTLFCGSRTLLLADVGSDLEMRSRLWALIGGGAPLGEIVAELESSDTGFALIDRDERASRALVRGDGVVSVVTANDEEAEFTSPTDLVLWAEYPLRAALRRVQLTVRGHDAPRDWLPISGGVTLAASAEFGSDQPLASAGSPLPASSAEDAGNGEGEGEAQTETGVESISAAYDFLFESTQRPLPAADPVETELSPTEPDPEESFALDAGATLLGEPLVHEPPVEEPPTALDAPGSLIESVPGVAEDRFSTVDVSEVDERTVARPRPREGSGGPMVSAVPCPEGHPNPPHTTACRVCGRAIVATNPVTVPRPLLGQLRLSTGAAIPLDRAAVFGRRPDASDFRGERPHLVQVASPDKDVSRNHVAVRLDGWHVLVSDLDSTNGTVLAMPGRDPQRLRPHEEIPIPPGTVVHLTDDVSFVYEVA